MAGYSKDEDCPGPDAVAHKADPYFFTYESWVKKQKDGTVFVFGRCVQTKNKVDLFVDWKKTSVYGYAQPGWPCHHEVPSLSEDSTLVKTQLWYGAAPAKIDAPYKEIKESTSAKAVEKTPPLSSRVKMSIPKIKGSPQSLRRIDVTFFSVVKSEKEGNVYTYSWKTASKTDTRDVRFRWRSQAVARARRMGEKNAEPMQLDKPAQLSFRVEARAAYALTVVEFLDERGREVVGKASVAVYYPVGSKP